MELGGRHFPAGVNVAPSISSGRPPHPGPGRELRGGGNRQGPTPRRHSAVGLGASFALLVMKVVLSTIPERAQLAAVRDRPRS
jgi:hypothetical protein